MVMVTLRLTQDDDDLRTNSIYQPKLVVAVIGMSLMFCLLWFFIVSALLSNSPFRPLICAAFNDGHFRFLLVPG
jgi:hypothetical protein